MIPAIITKTLARLWYSLDRRHRLITLRNLEFALGRELSREQREELAKKVFHHFVHLFFEAIGNDSDASVLVTKESHCNRSENAAAPWKLGKGILAIGAHAGNWELHQYGRWIHYIHPMALVARKHDHPLMNRIIRFLRERGGNTMIPKQGGLKAILTQLKKNQIVGMADRSEHHHQRWDSG